jgi:hypothetical protein
MKTTSYGRRSQNIKSEISQQPTVWIVTHEFLGGKLEENSEEISSVALLSPACYSFIGTSKVCMLPVGAAGNTQWPLLEKIGLSDNNDKQAGAELCQAQYKLVWLNQL